MNEPADTWERLDFLAEPIEAPELLGKRIVESRQAPVDFGDKLAADAYYKQQRELVRRFGRCADGCTVANLETGPNGRPVCFRTRQPCDNRRLALLLEHFEIMTNAPTTKRGELIPQSTRSALLDIEQVRADTHAAIVEAEQNGHEMLKGIVLAKGMQSLRQLLTGEVMADVMALQDSPLGFRTDKASSGGYKQDIVRDCLITALLQGFRVTGNEFNIIAGNFYGAQQGLKRLVEEWPGLHSLRTQLGVPASMPGGALVAANASWKVDGRPYSIECADQTKTGGIDSRIPVRVNSGQGADAILGKARRKLFALILERLTGIGELDDAEPLANEPTAPAAAEAALSSPQDDDDGTQAVSCKIGDQLAELVEETRQLIDGSNMVRECQQLERNADRVLDVTKAPAELLQSAREAVSAAAAARIAEIRAERPGTSANGGE